MTYILPEIYQFKFNNLFYSQNQYFNVSLTLVLNQPECMSVQSEITTPINDEGHIEVCEDRPQNENTLGSQVRTTCQESGNQVWTYTVIAFDSDGNGCNVEYDGTPPSTCTITSYITDDDSDLCLEPS